MVIYNIITTNLSPSRTLITYSEYKFYMCAYCVSLEVSYIWLCPQLWRARKTWCVGGVLDAHHVRPSLSRLLHICKPLITRHILVMAGQEDLVCGGRPGRPPRMSLLIKVVAYF